MAAAAPTASSTKETTNYARLCRLLVDIGTRALRDTLDAIHAPANLHTVLAANKSKLQSLKTKRVINPTQWGELFPAISTSVSSRSFDTTLLMVLLRNLCGLTAPLTGWDALPAVTDLSREADIARVKYFRNTVYGHAERASVDDTEFNDYWRDIRGTLVRLGGVTYEAAIDNLKNECMDPEVEGHYMELLSQWEKDDGNIKEELGEMKKLQEKMVHVQEEILQTQGKMLHALTSSKEIVDQGDLNVKHEIKLNIDTQKRTFKRQFAHAQIFLKHNARSPTKGLDGFLNHLGNDFGVSIKELKFDCFEVGVTCSKPNFERLWSDYRNGKLNKLTERFLLTKEVKNKLNLEGIEIRTVVEEEELVKSSRRVSKSGINTAVMRIEILTQNHGTRNRNFATDINIFKKRDSFSPSYGLSDFLKRVARDYFLEIPAFGFGCLEIRMECPSLAILEKLWKNYRSGHLDKIGKRYLLTDEVKSKAQLKIVNITTLIKDDEYNSCKRSFSEGVERLGRDVGPGTNGEPHEMKIKVSLDQIDVKKEEKFNQHLVEQISMFMEYNTFSPNEGVGLLIEHIKKVHNLLIKTLGLGCLEIQVECLNLESLESLKNDYCSGHLGEMAEKFILTDEVREKLDLKDISLKTTIKREDYLACRKSFLKAAEPFSKITNPEIIASSQTDQSQSQAEGNGLKEAEQGADANFTITTRDSEGKQVYSEQDHVTVTIRSPTWEVKAETIDSKDGNYTAHYKPKCVGRNDVTIEVDGWPLTGSPWRVNVKPHQYKVINSCGSLGSGEGEFNGPRSVAQNKLSGNIAVVDTLNNRLQVFDENLKYLRTIGGEVGSLTGAALTINHPLSAAFSRNGDVVVIHSIEGSTQMSLITDDGQFIRKFSEYVIRPSTIFVRNDHDDGHVIVCDKADCKIKVLSPDGAQLLNSFNAPDCKDSPACVFYHRDKFFVSYHIANCIKVFNEEGEFLFNIGCEGPGEGLLDYPSGLVVDAFDNLIVCDNRNNRLQMFTLDGEFLSSFYQEVQSPWGMAISKYGDLLVTDIGKQSLIILR